MFTCSVVFSRCGYCTFTEEKDVNTSSTTALFPPLGFFYIPLYRVALNVSTNSKIKHTFLLVPIHRALSINDYQITTKTEVNCLYLSK